MWMMHEPPFELAEGGALPADGDGVEVEAE
jgi:hypothetical protein